MMNKQYYTDQEIIDGLDDLKEDFYVQCEKAKCELMVAAMERIEQKQMANQSKGEQMNVYNHEQFMDAIRSISMDAETFEALESYSLMREKQLEFMRERVDVAANLIGHNTISECLYER